MDVVPTLYGSNEKPEKQISELNFSIFYLFIIKVSGYTFRGSNLYILIFPLFKIEIYSKKKNLLLRK